jgi:hypothetical protein
MLMTVFNRVVVVVVALVLLVGALITLLVATGATAPDDYGWFSFILQKAADATGAGLVITIVVAVIIALGTLALLLFELAISRQPITLLISSSEEGVTTINQESVCVLAEKTAATVSNVRDVHCSVGEKVGGLIFSCQALVSLASNVPEVCAELQGKVKENVEKLTGLPVAQINVKTKYESSDAKRLSVR